MTLHRAHWSPGKSGALPGGPRAAQGVGVCSRPGVDSSATDTALYLLIGLRKGLNLAQAGLPVRVTDRTWGLARGMTFGPCPLLSPEPLVLTFGSISR